MINLTFVGRTKLTVLATVEVYISTSLAMQFVPLRVHLCVRSSMHERQRIAAIPYVLIRLF